MLNKNLLMIALVAVTAGAQTSMTPAQSTTATKPSTSTATKPASQTVAPSAAASKPSTPATSAKTATTAKSAPAKKMASPEKVKADIQAKAEKPAAAKQEPVKTAGRRDPFVSPLRQQEERAKSVVCTTGVRCLIIDQVELKGIVKTQQGMIAMVENPPKKQYNLHEKDNVFNGQVMKITGDSLIFRENMTDSMGHQSTREVVKKVTAPVI